MDDNINVLDRIEFQEIFEKHSFLIYECSTFKPYKRTENGKIIYGNRIMPLYIDLQNYLIKHYSSKEYLNCKKFEGYKYTTPLGNTVEFKCEQNYEQAWIEIE